MLVNVGERAIISLPRPELETCSELRKDSMRKVSITLIASVVVSVSYFYFPSTIRAQNREKFVISARAGGVNAVTGRAAMRPHGNSEWQQLTIKEDLETGDIVRTGLDGRVEMLLNPGSYMRIAENSEFEMADNSLENLEVRLIRGTAIVEVTGAEDTELLINISTPHTRMAIVRRGLYRVNVVPGDGTELIVRKGRVMLEGSHTKVKGGNKVVFSSNSFSVAKLEKADSKNPDDFDGWSKERAHTLAEANSKLSIRTVNAFISSFNNDWYFNVWDRSGIWLFNPGAGCFTFFPFGYGWGSPYGGSYSRFFYAGGYCCGRGFGHPLHNVPTIPGVSPGVGTGTSGGITQNPSLPSPPVNIPDRFPQAANPATDVRPGSNRPLPP
jgi:hypothetical protein